MSTPSPVTLSLPFAPSSAAVARNQLKAWLVELGAASEVIEDSRLVVSELVGNSVRHAAPLGDGTVEIAWAPDHTNVLDIAVSDGGALTHPVVAAAETDAESGRGLSIVESLTDRWWRETTRTRSTVHALIQLAAAPTARSHAVRAG